MSSRTVAIARSMSHGPHGLPFPLVTILSVPYCLTDADSSSVKSCGLTWCELFGLNLMRTGNTVISLGTQ